MKKLLLPALFFVLVSSSMAAPKNLSLLVIEGDSYIINKALASFAPPNGISVRYATLSELESGNETRQFVASSPVLIVDVMQREIADYAAGLVKENSSRRIYALRGSRKNGLLKEKGLIFDKTIASYYNNITVDNIRNMILRVINQELDSSVAFEEPVTLPEAGLFHPDVEKVFNTYRSYRNWYTGRDGYRKNLPVAGLMVYPSTMREGQAEKTEKIIKRLEKSGFNVLPAFGKDRKIITELFVDSETGRPNVDIVLAFSLKFYSGLDKDVQKGISRLDVPFFNAIHLYNRTITDWRDDPVGIPPTDVVWKIANPEISGLIEPTPVSGAERLTDPVSGKRVDVHKIIPEALDHLIPRMKKFVRLQKMANADKKIALFYYNHSPGKQNVGASYLNVFQSIESILKRLEKEGYRTGNSEKISEKAIRDMILLTGRNIGNWAPGELEKMLRKGSVIKVSLEKYKSWFEALPQKFRENVIRQWGKPSASSIMVKDGFFIIPAVTMGNFVLLPEPSRGWGDDPMKLYHDPLVHPHHQYIAAYLWIKNVLAADAMIHLGTHATYEWLPGKQAGLSPSCPPEIMVTDIPNFYPYIVDDVGEGIQAKRRGRGVIIDHLTPSLKEGGLYHDYSKLYSLISDYTRSEARGAAVSSVKFEEIKTIAGETGILKDLGIKDLDLENLETLEHYLLELKSNLMPYGLHAFGISPPETEASETAACIVSRNSKADKKELTANILASGQEEINKLVSGLNGHYIPSGEGNDPVRNPTAVPTGKNFYGFSPVKVPSPAAWKLGKKAANDIIEKRLKEDKHYPEKVAVVLWATETIRNEGINESTILFLMGLRPVWDKSGRVTATEVIPGRALKRPRIDVLINPSGLYRDLFPGRLLMLDKAVQQAMLQTDIENLLKKNSDRIKNRLLASGKSPESAEIMSKLRIFTAKPGSYGNGVAEMAGNSGFWKSDDEIVQVYEKRMGFAFGAGKWGEKAAEVFRENLKDVDTAVHSRSSNIYATMDNDDMFQYLGGLTLAVKKERGEEPDTVISRQPTPDSIEVEDVEKTIGRELRTRYLNPKWIRGMQKENYAGAREMSEFAENMWGWQVTVPDAIDAAKWKQTYEVYVEDKYGLGIKQFFDRENPWAGQSMSGRMLEAVRKKYWQADEKTRKELAKTYAVSVIEKGVACCDHTCNNPLLNQMVVSLISLPGVLSPEMVEQFKIAVASATGKTMEKHAEDLDQLHKRVTGPRPDSRTQKKASDKKTGSDGEQTVKGYKMEKIKSRDTETSVVSSGVQWAASLFVLFIVGLILYGSFRKNR